MEGGGERSGTKAALRQGMDVFLEDIKTACRERNWHWRLVCCGARNETYKRFYTEFTNGDGSEIIVLLVDSEGPVGVSASSEYLTKRDEWDFHGVEDHMIHLMVQTMETWIVADPIALSTYYGQRFHEKSLPRRPNLEEERKSDVTQALVQATERTQKGRYDKIRHAHDLLKRINPMSVRQRCGHCDRLFETLLAWISKGSGTCQR